jgi:hypothetical protein
VNVEKMNALLDMQERLIGRQALAEFNSGFARLQGRLPRIKKNGTLEYPVNKNDPDGPKRKIANFARWEDIMAEIGPLMQEDGFALTFESAPRTGEGGGLIVSGTLLHVAGHSRTASMPLPLDNSGGKNNLQGYGSTFKYGCRYTATMLLNIVTEGEDDDGVRGADEFLSAQQVKEIDALLVSSGANLGGFLDFMEVKSVEEIQVRDFAKAMNSLHAKARQMENMRGKKL